MSDNSNMAMVTTEQRDELIPAFVMTITQARSQLAQLREFVKEVMVKDEDYGAIPGTDKPTLLKPGAEKLNEIYGYAPVTEVTHRVEDWENGFFHYECRTRLVSKRTGSIIAEGIGSCNSRESKYAGRWAWGNEVPSHLDKARLKKREFNKKDGSGTVAKYLIPNDDIYSIVNTLLKMASKRSLIDATLRATRSSALFTQDMEDLQDAHVIDATPQPPRRETPATTRPARPEPRQARQAEPPPHIIDQEPIPEMPPQEDFALDTLKRECNQAFDVLKASERQRDVFVQTNLGKARTNLDLADYQLLALILECRATMRKIDMHEEQFVGLCEEQFGEGWKPKGQDDWNAVKGVLVDLAAEREEK